MDLRILHFNVLSLLLFQRLGSNFLYSIKAGGNKYAFEETMSVAKIMYVIEASDCIIRAFLVESRLNKNEIDFPRL